MTASSWHTCILLAFTLAVKTRNAGDINRMFYATPTLKNNHHTEASKLPLNDTLSAMMRASLAAAAFIMLFVSAGIAADRPASFADLAEELTPSVVNISTTTVVRGRNNPMPEFPEGSPFEDFFKEFGDRERPRQGQSLGSGFIIDKEGYVVTNNHVIENADQITVFLSNDESFTAEVIGTDAKTDIALLKFDPDGKELTAVEFGNSDTMRVGDWVMAIGNPFGLGGSVTAGIVSARGRDIGSGPYDDYIQTDASINRGNSGGPLFNLEGEVIGINTAIFSQSGGSVGIGFAISSNLAKQVVAQLRDFGRTKRGWLGVFIQEVTEDIADSLGLDAVEGALVASVTEDGPADKAGIEAGDVITTFNESKVERSRDLPRIVAETPVDKTVPVDVIRNGKKERFDVTLGELEAAENGGLLSQRSSGQGDERAFAGLGFSVASLTDALAEKYDLEMRENVVVITAVESGSPAADKQLQEGQIIRRLNQTAISSVEMLAEGIEAAQAAERKGVLMLIEDANGQTRFVQVSFE